MARLAILMCLAKRAVIKASPATKAITGGFAPSRSIALMLTMKETIAKMKVHTLTDLRVLRSHFLSKIRFYLSSVSVG